MIFEQSFFNLPEILVGARFLEQAYETGVTGAFAMAVFQELNGRNVNNPLGHIQLEHSYLVPDGSAKRAIRADMFLRTQNIGVSNSRLDAYGWRHSNFLEAKFIRESSNQTLARAELAVDIVRLSCLARSRKQEDVGRYLLHVYRGRPEELVGGKKTQGGKDRKNFLPWLGQIRMPGKQEIELTVKADRTKKFSSYFQSGLSNLVIAANISTLEIKPVSQLDKSLYWCYLTKIESFRVELDVDWFNVAADRRVTESSGGARDRIWRAVYQSLDPSTGAEATVSRPRLVESKDGGSASNV